MNKKMPWHSERLVETLVNYRSSSASVWPVFALHHENQRVQIILKMALNGTLWYPHSPQKIDLANLRDIRQLQQLLNDSVFSGGTLAGRAFAFLGSLETEMYQYVKERKDGLRICILGCGTGIQVLNFASLCTEKDAICAVDTDQTALERAKTLCNQSTYNPHQNVPITFHREDANTFLERRIMEQQGHTHDTAYDHRKFDIILAANLIHYLGKDDAVNLLNRCKSALATNGRVYLFWFPENRTYPGLNDDVQRGFDTPIQTEWNRCFAGSRLVYKTCTERPDDTNSIVKNGEKFDEGMVCSIVYRNV